MRFNAFSSDVRPSLEAGMVCEQCGRQITAVSTSLVAGKKVTSFLCERCRQGKRGPTPPALERPCAGCKEREGTIKRVRMQGTLRIVSYLCDACAPSGMRKG